MRGSTPARCLVARVVAVLVALGGGGGPLPRGLDQAAQQGEPAVDLAAECQITERDIRDGLDAAAAVGDDRIQEPFQGRPFLVDRV